MPFKAERITSGKNKGKWRVINTDTRSVKASATTEANAKAQVRLLEGIKHGMKVRS